MEACMKFAEFIGQKKVEAERREQHESEAAGSNSEAPAEDARRLLVRISPTLYGLAAIS